jgi:hypothetical protein
MAKDVFGEAAVAVQVNLRRPLDRGEWLVQRLVLQQYFVIYKPAAPVVAAAGAGLAEAPLA